tara:strand:+ start:1294 stop:2445 length:1152 start_codon:yes stop_codon:yes gene_type:complete
MAKNYQDNWLDIIKRLQELSNVSPEEERHHLLEAAKQEPKILDDNEITLADIAKLAGIKEYTTTVVSKQAEALIESITRDETTTESIITTAIRESDADESISATITKVVTEDSKRLDTIAELETKLAELKAEQKAEQTYDADAFREVLAKDIKEYIKTAEAAELVELYNSVSEHDAVYNEESSSILIKTEDTKEIIADAEKIEQEIIAEKEKEESKDEVVQEHDNGEFTDQQIKQAFGILNDPKFKGGNYDGAVEVIEKLAKGLSKHPSVANALMRANEDTVEASGYEGQDEYHAHIIRLNGDFDAESPVSDADAELVKQTIMKNSGEEGRSIVVDVEPAEGAYDSVVVHSARSKEEIIGYLGDMVDETAEVPYTDELSETKK